MIQDTKESASENIKVFFRILPNDSEYTWERIKILDDKKHMYVRSLQDFGKGKENRIPTYWKFETDGLFYNAPQIEIYNAATTNIYSDLLQGSNVVILSYGQTGSGKSLTTTALKNNYEDRGIVPRVIETLYAIKDGLDNKSKMCIQIKYVEVNRQFIRDLLGKDPDLLYDMTTYKEIKPLKAKNIDDAFKLLFIAESNKTVKEQEFYTSNMASSIITFTITMKYSNRSDLLTGNLHIVDLSGLDTIGNFSCLHKSGYEVGGGNLAKSQLEQFVLILNAFNQANVLTKQRLCIIIHYLRDALNRQSIIRLIGHIRIPDDDLKITLSMLKFGCIVRGIIPQKLSTNISTDPEIVFKKLEDKVKQLRKEKELNSMLNNNDLIRNLSQARQEYVAQLANDYLNGKLDEIPLLHTTDIIQTMKMFKNLYNKIEMERKELINLVQSQKQEEGTLKTKESSVLSKLSKKSKHSSHGNVGSSKNKKSPSSRKKSKESMSLVSRDALHSPKISQTSKTHSVRPPSSRAVKKKKKSSESVHTKSEAASYALILPQLPETIPMQEEVWLEFQDEKDPEVMRLNEELIEYEKRLEDTNKLYADELIKFQKANELLTIRKGEAYKLNLLKDLQEEGKESNSFTELDTMCNSLLKNAENELVEVKENILTLQTELKLILEYKSIVKFEINKKFEDYCTIKFNIAMPIIENENDSPSSIKTEKESSEEVFNFTVEESANIEKYQLLQKLLMKLVEKRLRTKTRNQKWIQSCKLDNH